MNFMNSKKLQASKIPRSILINIFFKKLPNCWGVNGVPSINVAAEVIEPSFSAVAAAFL